MNADSPNHHPPPLRILWDGDIQASKPCGGISRYCEGILSELGQYQDLKLLALCPKAAPAFRVQAPNLRQISRWDLPVIDRFRLQRFQPEIFHSAHYQSSPLEVPVTIQTVLDFVDRRFPVFYSNRDGFAAHQLRCLQDAQGVVAISESTRQDTLEFTGIPEDKIVVAYPGTSAVFRQPLCTTEQIHDARKKLTGGAPYIIWVGPRNGYKNFRTFFSGFARVARKLDLHLFLAGGEFPRLGEEELRIAMQERICDRVHARRHVSDEDLRLYYAGAAALAQSSLWEGFGIPLVEAVSCGTRLLVSDIPVFREVAGGDAGYADPYDSSSWEDALLKLMEETPAPAQERKQRMEEKFSPEVSGKTIHAFYQRLLEEHRKDRASK